MQGHAQSLREYLQVPNPLITPYGDISGGPSEPTKSVYDRPVAIYKWTDFEYDTLTQFAGGDLDKTLDRSFVLEHIPNVLKFPFSHFSDEDSLSCSLSKWSQSKVCEALAKTQEFHKKPREPIFMVRGGQSKSTDPGRRRKPDWGGMRQLNSEEATKKMNILPGETKVGQKWSSKNIKVGLRDPKTKIKSLGWMKPIGQIFSYCLRNNTRYGYLFTDMELVVVRVRLLPDPEKRVSFVPSMNASEDLKDAIIERGIESGVLDFKAIPWDCSEDLTINIALWWLHLIATGNIGIGDTYCHLRDEVWGIDYELLVSLILTPLLSIYNALCDQLKRPSSAYLSPGKRVESDRNEKLMRAE